MNARVGATVSRRIVTDIVEVPPSEVAEQVNVMPAVSSVTKFVRQPVVELTFDSKSSTSHTTCTLLRYQPPLPSVP